MNEVRVEGEVTAMWDRGEVVELRVQVPGSRLPIPVWMKPGPVPERGSRIRLSGVLRRELRSGRSWTEVEAIEWEVV